MNALTPVPSTPPTATGLVPQNMADAMRLAEMMSKGKLVPAHLQGSPSDCLMVIEQAIRWRMSPFAVAQATSVIQGKLMFEGKLVAAALHTSGALTSRLRYDYSGEGDTREVVVSATLANENEVRSVKIRLKDARTSNPLWTKQADQQLAYHGARVWARRYTPEVILGVYSPEEMEPARRESPHTGPTIDAQVEAPPPEMTREELLEQAAGVGLPLTPAPTTIPPPTIPPDKFLARVSRALGKCASAADVLRFAEAPAYRAEVATQDAGTAQHAQDMIAEAYARFQPPVATDDADQGEYGV